MGADGDLGRLAVSKLVVGHVTRISFSLAHFEIESDSGERSIHNVRDFSHWEPLLKGKIVEVYIGAGNTVHCKPRVLDLMNPPPSRYPEVYTRPYSLHKEGCDGTTRAC